MLDLCLFLVLSYHLRYTREDRENNWVKIGIELGSSPTKRHNVILYTIASYALSIQDPFQSFKRSRSEHPWLAGAYLGEYSPGRFLGSPGISSGNLSLVKALLYSSALLPKMSPLSCRQLSLARPPPPARYGVAGYSFVDVSVVSMQVRSITFRKDLES